VESCSKLKIAITGTTSGIGKALAKRLEQDHWLWEINRPHLDLLEDSVLTALDLTGYDVLINNAGADYNRADFISHEYVDWQRTIKINMQVPMYLTQKFMQQNSTGTVINITSTGRHRLPTTNSSVFYRASKKALKLFTEEINETHNNFRIVDIEPGKTQTNFTENAGSFTVHVENAMHPDSVVDSVIFALSNTCITRLTVKNLQ